MRKLRVYLDTSVINFLFAEDALHIAVATVNDADVFLSWNYRHLANVNKDLLIRAVNLRAGYTKPMRMTTPLEVMGEQDQGLQSAARALPVEGGRLPGGGAPGYVVGTPKEASGRPQDDKKGTALPLRPPSLTGHPKYRLPRVGNGLRHSRAGASRFSPPVRDGRCGVRFEPWAGRPASQRPGRPGRGSGGPPRRPGTGTSHRPRR